MSKLLKHDLSAVWLPPCGSCCWECHCQSLLCSWYTFSQIVETSWTHGGRYWGLWHPSLGAGSKTACTARSCVQRCCEDSLRRPHRWRSLMPCRRPCQSDTSPSGGCSCTLKKNRRAGSGFEQVQTTGEFRRVEISWNKVIVVGQE